MFPAFFLFYALCSLFRTQNINLLFDMIASGIFKFFSLLPSMIHQKRVRVYLINENAHSVFLSTTRPTIKQTTHSSPLLPLVSLLCRFSRMYCVCDSLSEDFFESTLAGLLLPVKNIYKLKKIQGTVWLG